MSLLDDIKLHYQSECSPPEGPDLDWDFIDDNWVRRTDGVVTEQVSYEIIDNSPRWGSRIQVVYRRGDEYVAVRDVEPATESQDWGDYGDPAIAVVKPFEETIVVTKYRKV